MNCRENECWRGTLVTSTGTRARNGQSDKSCVVGRYTRSYVRFGNYRARDRPRQTATRTLVAHHVDLAAALDRRCRGTGVSARPRFPASAPATNCVDGSGLPRAAAFDDQHRDTVVNRVSSATAGAAKRHRITGRKIYQLFPTGRAHHKSKQFIEGRTLSHMQEFRPSLPSLPRK